MPSRSMVTLDRAGNVCSVNSRPPKPMIASASGTSSLRARASSSAPWARRSEPQKTASSPAPRSSSCASPCRPCVSVEGAATVIVCALAAVTRSISLQESAAPRQRALVVGGDQTQAEMALRQQVPGDRLADLFMGEPDQHVDRRGGHVPHLDDRDPRGQQPLPDLERMVDAGEQDRIRAAAQNRSEQRFLARRRIARQAQQHLVPRYPQGDR